MSKGMRRPAGLRIALRHLRNPDSEDYGIAEEIREALGMQQGDKWEDDHITLAYMVGQLERTQR